MKKPKLEKLSKIYRRLWSMCRFIVLARYNNKCVVCSISDIPLDVHHILPRELHILKYDTSNMVCLCKKCHKFSRTLSAHRNSVAFVLFLQKNYPEINLHELISKSSEPINLKDRQVLKTIEGELNNEQIKLG